MHVLHERPTRSLKYFNQGLLKKVQYTEITGEIPI